MIRKDEKKIFRTIRKTVNHKPDPRKMFLSNAFEDQVGKPFPIKIHGKEIGTSTLLSALQRTDGSFDMEFEMVVQE